MGAEMNFYFDLVSYNANNKRFLSRCTCQSIKHQEKYFFQVSESEYLHLELSTHLDIFLICSISFSICM